MLSWKNSLSSVARYLQEQVRELPPVSQLFFILAGIYFLLFWMRAFHTDAAGNMLAGHENIWGDGAAHLTMISTFAYRASWPDQSPLLIGNTFGYPFAVNAISGWLAKAGLPLFLSFTLVSFILCIIAVWAVYQLALHVLGKHRYALVATIVYFCNGGVGWYYYVQSIITSPNPVLAIINPFRYITHMPEFGFDYINVIHSMLLGQRAFTLGLPIGVGLIYLFYSLFRLGYLSRWQRIAVVVGLGTLPLVHSHTFLSFILIMPIWTLWELAYLVHQKKWAQLEKLLKELSIIVAAAGILATLTTVYILKPNIGERFVRWQPGWYSVEQHKSWLWYWFLNWGITPYIALWGLYLFIRDKKAPHLVGFIWGCCVAFILSNLLIWQPNIFDNSKIFAWTSVGAALMVTYALRHCWHHQGIFRRMVTIALAIFIIFSGALDVYRVVRTDLHSYVMYTAEELELAEWVKTNTPENSIWLTSDRHNNWLYNLTGRQALMAYRGWLWTHGYNYRTVEHDMSLMFTNPASYQALFATYGVTHISLGPQEYSEWKAARIDFENTFVILHQTENYLILGKRP
jgi:hypothetical protein